MSQASIERRTGVGEDAGLRPDGGPQWSAPLPIVLLGNPRKAA